MTKFTDFLAEQLQNPELKLEYEKLEPEFELVQELINAMKSMDITSEELSERTGVTKRVITGIENGSANPSLNTLKKIAKGLDRKLKIEFV